MKRWRALLIIYRELDVRLKIGRRARKYRQSATELELADACESFAALPALIADLTDNLVEMKSEVAFAENLRSLTARLPNEYWPSPNDTRAELDRRAPRGKYDSLFIFWPQHDFAAGSSVPGSAWGLGMGASDWSNGATYAAVANAPHQTWRNERPGEVWLHEWLHGVCHYFAEQGYTMPERDADGGELHGYTRSATNGWCDYYRDLMSRSVREAGRIVGIPRTAWSA